MAGPVNELGALRLAPSSTPTIEQINPRCSECLSVIGPVGPEIGVPLRRRANCAASSHHPRRSAGWCGTRYPTVDGAQDKDTYVVSKSSRLSL